MPLALHVSPAPLATFAADPANIPAWRLLHQEADRLMPELATLWETLFRDVQANVDLVALQRALERGNVLEAEALLSALWEQHASGPARLTLPVLLRATVERAASAVTPHLAQTVQVTLGFPMPALAIPASLPWLETYAGTQIQGIGERSLLAIRGLMREGFAAGTSVQRLAERIREQVGLTRRQTETVARFRQRLSDEGFSARRIAQEVQSATRVGIRQRALNIARTESMWAANAGQEELWRQAQTQGLMQPGEWERQWLTARDERVCPICVPMGGQRRELEQPFTTPGGGGVAFPPAHPSCRCTLVLVARGSE